MIPPAVKAGRLALTKCRRSRARASFRGRKPPLLNRLRPNRTNARTHLERLENAGHTPEPCVVRSGAFDNSSHAKGTNEAEDHETLEPTLRGLAAISFDFKG